MFVQAVIGNGPTGLTQPIQNHRHTQHPKGLILSLVVSPVNKLLLLRIQRINGGLDKATVYRLFI